MVKVETIGMIADNKKNDPTVIAHADIPNGYFHTVANGVTVAPVAGSSTAAQSADLRVAINTGIGDDEHTDFIINKGEYVNSFLVKAWEGQNLVVNEANIAYATGKSFADIAVNDIMVANADGKLEVAEASANYGVYFTVVKKTQYGKNAVVVKINLG